MIPRRIDRRLARLLDEFPAVALLGPRQVGKTTLARVLVAKRLGLAPVDYLDLENPADLAKLDDDQSPDEVAEDVHSR